MPSLLAAWLLVFGSAHTRRNYASDIAGWLKFCDTYCIDPLAARRPHIDAWARSLETSGRAPRTVARPLAAVSSWYGFLVVEEVRPGSPAEHVRRPRVSDEGETPGLTRDELRRLLAAAEEHGSPRSVALMSVLAHTGVRIGEALSRDVEDLGYDRGHRILRLDRKGGKSGRAVLAAPVTRGLKPSGAFRLGETGRPGNALDALLG